MRTCTGPSSPRPSNPAFSLTELLVVLSLLALLFLTLIPARASVGFRSSSLQCLDNLRQLMDAIMLYTADNHDLFPPNPDDGTTVLGHNWCPGQAGRGGAQEFNPDVLADPYRCLITDYINRNVELFRCSADTRTGLYSGGDPAKRGATVPAARSITMNGAVGTICSGFNSFGGHSGRPDLSVNGPWLNNTHSHIRNSPWRTYGKVSETLVPGPAQLFVLMEEDAYSINDASFCFGMNIAEWIDWPSTRHGMAAAIAFADGRAELHKWVDPTTEVIGGSVSRKAVPGSPDWQWLREHTSARAR